MDTQPSSNGCPKCHAPLPPDAPQGLCPKCLFAAVATPTEAGQPAGQRATPPPLDEIAAAFPQLEILEFIGQGGMGFVFKARQPKLDRLVALKILPQSLATDPTFAERFNREARLLARLNHPGIVTVHDFGVASPQPSTLNSQPFYYLLMEFVDGVNLRQAMQAGRFTPDQALAIVPKICEALQFAHNEGILHRDIKPENILLDAKGRVKLADFGIAKLMEQGRARHSARAAGPGPSLGVPPLGGPLPANPDRLKPELQAALTETGKTLGTPNYMAPEQLNQPGDVDHRADIYSLGVVFYEMLTGELPLGRFAPPSEKSTADTRVDEVVLRALEKEKTKRYASADEVKTSVETISCSSGHESVPTKTGTPSTQLTRGTIARRSALVAAIVALVVFAVTAVITSLMPPTYVATARVTLTNDVISNYDPYQIQTDFARMESPDSLKQVGELANLRTRWRDQLFGNEYAQNNVITVRLRGAMELRPVRGTAFVEIRYHSTSAGEAADIANATAKIFCQLSGARLLDEATEPRTPVHPNAFTNRVIGFVIACVLGLIAGGITALFLGMKVSADDPTPAAGDAALPQTKTPWVAASLFTLTGLASLALMIFRHETGSISILPGALALPIGIGLFRGSERCRRLATWGLALSFVFSLCMCGWVVGKAFGLFPQTNLVALFLGQPVDSHLGALALFVLMLAQLIAYPLLVWTLSRSEVRAHFASPSRKLPGAEAGLTLVILLLMFTQVHMPMQRSWQTGIIFANPPTATQATDTSPAALEKLEQEANRATKQHASAATNPTPATNTAFSKRDYFMMYAWDVSYNLTTNVSSLESRWQLLNSAIVKLRDEGLEEFPDDVLIHRELAWLFQHRMSLQRRSSDLASTYIVTGPDPDQIYFRYQWSKLFQQAQAQGQIQSRLKLDPALMKSVDEQYGPLDWRLPESHAIYWASHRLNSKPALAKDEAASLQRVVYQSLRQSFLHGKLIGEPSLTEMRLEHNLRLASKVNASYERELLDAASDPQTQAHIDTGHRNFLRDAVMALYENGQQQEANGFYAQLSKRYPNKPIVDSDPHSLPAQLTCEEFVRRQQNEK